MVRHNFTLKLYFSDATFDERKCKKYLKILCFKQQNSFFTHLKHQTWNTSSCSYIFFVVFIFYWKITLTLLLSDILIKYVLFSIYYLIKVKIVYIIFSQSFITVVNWLYIVYAHSVCKKMSSWMADPNIYLDNDKNTYLRPDWFQFSLLLYS